MPPNPLSSLSLIDEEEYDSWQASHAFDATNRTAADLLDAEEGERYKREAEAFSAQAAAVSGVFDEQMPLRQPSISQVPLRQPPAQNFEDTVSGIRAAAGRPPDPVTPVTFKNVGQGAFTALSQLQAQNYDTGDYQTWWAAACAAASYASVMSYLGRNMNISTAIKELGPSRISSQQGLLDASLKSMAGAMNAQGIKATARNMTIEELQQRAGQGVPIIVDGVNTGGIKGWGAAGHIFTVTGVDQDGNFTIADPAEARSRLTPAEMRQVWNGNVGAALTVSEGMPTSGGNPRYAPPTGNPIIDFAMSKAVDMGLDPELVRRIVGQESGGNPDALSSAGAKGVMQVMPGTERGVREKYGIQTGGWQGNVEVGLTYFKEQLDKFQDPRLALAAYNAGPGAVLSGAWKGYGETTSYVRIIGGDYGGTGYVPTNLKAPLFSPRSAPGVGGDGLTVPVPGVPRRSSATHLNLFSGLAGGEPPTPRDTSSLLEDLTRKTNALMRVGGDALAPGGVARRSVKGGLGFAAMTGVAAYDIAALLAENLPGSGQLTASRNVLPKFDPMAVGENVSGGQLSRTTVPFFDRLGTSDTEAAHGRTDPLVDAIVERYRPSYNFSPEEVKGIKDFIAENTTLASAAVNIGSLGLGSVGRGLLTAKTLASATGIDKYVAKGLVKVLVKEMAKEAVVYQGAYMVGGGATKAGLHLAGAGEGWELAGEIGGGLVGVVGMAKALPGISMALSRTGASAQNAITASMDASWKGVNDALTKSKGLVLGDAAGSAVLGAVADQANRFAGAVKGAAIGLLDNPATFDLIQRAGGMRFVVQSGGTMMAREVAEAAPRTAGRTAADMERFSSTLGRRESYRIESGGIAEQLPELNPQERAKLTATLGVDPEEAEFEARLMATMADPSFASAKQRFVGAANETVDLLTAAGPAYADRTVPREFTARTVVASTVRAFGVRGEAIADGDALRLVDREPALQSLADMLANPSSVDEIRAGEIVDDAFDVFAPLAGDNEKVGVMQQWATAQVPRLHVALMDAATANIEEVPVAQVGAILPPQRVQVPPPPAQATPGAPSPGHSEWLKEFQVQVPDALRAGPKEETFRQWLVHSAVTGDTALMKSAVTALKEGRPTAYAQALKRGQSEIASGVAGKPEIEIRPEVAREVEAQIGGISDSLPGADPRATSTDSLLQQVSSPEQRRAFKAQGDRLAAEVPAELEAGFGRAYAEQLARETPARAAWLKNRSLVVSSQRAGIKDGSIHPVIQEAFDKLEREVVPVKQIVRGMSADEVDRVIANNGWTSVMDAPEAIRTKAMKDLIDSPKRKVDEAKAADFAQKRIATEAEAGVPGAVYAYLTRGQAIPTTGRPSVHVIFDQGTTARVTSPAPHYMAVFPGDSLHASKRASPARKLVQAAEGVPLPPEERANLLIGPEGENTAMAASLFNEVSVDALKEAIKTGDSEKLMLTMLRGKGSQGATFLADQLPKDLPDRLEAGKMATGSGLGRAEVMLPNPSLANVQALYVVGPNDAQYAADLAKARQLADHIEATTNRKVPVIQKAIEPDINRFRVDAEEYVESVGLPPIREVGYVKNDVEAQKRIAEVYDKAVSTPDDPEVRAAYEALAKEVNQQYEFLVGKGVTFEPYFTPAEGYKSSAEMMADLSRNNRLRVAAHDLEHPLLTGATEGDAVKDSPAWRFRAVHDYFGHTKESLQFGPRGEENAWLEHSKMFSPEARRAMTTETRGQNSWVNYGPNSDRPIAERPFAEQKAFLLPDEFVGRDLPPGAIESPVRREAKLPPSEFGTARGEIRDRYVAAGMRDIGQINAQFASDLGSAAAGGAATAAATDEDDPNRALKIAGGALAGGVVGAAAVRGAAHRLPAEASADFASGGAGRLMGLPAEGPPESPKYVRYFHGTGSVYDTPDPGKFDANGLFGPGYYITDDARVATGYASQRQSGLAKISPNEAMQAVEAVAMDFPQRPDLRTLMKSALDDWGDRPVSQEGFRAALAGILHKADVSFDDLQSSLLRHLGRSGGNIRPVDVPEGLRMLDADARDPDPSQVQRIVRALDPDTGRAFVTEINGHFAFMRNPTPDDVTGEVIYKSLQAAIEKTRGAGKFSDAVDAKEAANQALQTAGYDGIRYSGGKRIPMRADDGSPIEHTAAVIFPESLGKITNALSAKAGGQINAQFAMDIAGAVAAAQGAFVDDDDPMAGARRALAAGGMTLLGGKLVSKTPIGSAVIRNTTEKGQSVGNAVADAILGSRYTIGIAANDLSVAHIGDVKAAVLDLVPDLSRGLREAGARDVQVFVGKGGWLDDETQAVVVENSLDMTFRSKNHQAVLDSMHDQGFRWKQKSVLVQRTGGKDTLATINLGRRFTEEEIKEMSEGLKNLFPGWTFTWRPGQETTRLALTADAGDAPRFKDEVSHFVKELEEAFEVPEVNWKGVSNNWLDTKVERKKPLVGTDGRNSPSGTEGSGPEYPDAGGQAVSSAGRSGGDVPGGVPGQPGTTEAALRGEGPLEGRTEGPRSKLPNINPAKYSEDVQDVIATLEADGRAAAYLDDLRRNPVSWEEMEATAIEMGNDPMAVRGLLNTKRTVFMDHELFLLRSMWQGKIDELATLAADVGRLDPEHPDAIMAMARQELATQEADAIARQLVPGASEAGRALGSLRKNVTKAIDTGDIATLSDWLANTTPPRIAKDLSIEIRKLNPEDPYYRQQVYSILQKRNDPTWWGKVDAWRYFSMLASPLTLSAQNVGNAGKLVGRVLWNTAASRHGEAKSDAMGIVAAYGDAKNAGWGTLVTGVSQSALSRAETARPKAFGSGVVGRIIDAPMTANAAADDFWRTLSHGGALNAIVYREMKGDAMKIAEIHGAKNYQQSWLLEAAEEAKKTTFQQDPTGFAKSLMNLRAQHRSIGLILPFIKTPAAIYKEGMQLLVSPAVGGFELATGRSLSLEKLTPRQRQDAQAKLIIGTSMYVGIAGLAASGNLTGSGPKDPDKRALLETTDWQANSVRIGGRWVSYSNLGPIAIPLSIVANANDSLNEAERKDEPEVATFLHFLTATGRSLTDASYISAVGDFFRMAENFEGSAQSLLTSLGRSFVPAGSLLSYTQRRTDDFQRQPTKLMDDPWLAMREGLMAQIPGLSAMVAPKISGLGEPIRNDRSWESGLVPFRNKALGSSDAAEVALSADYVPSTPGREIEFAGEKRRLTSEERYDLKAGRGEAISPALERLSSSSEYILASDEKKAELVRGVSRAAGSGAEEKVLGRDPVKKPERPGKYVGIEPYSSEEEAIDRAKQKVAAWRANKRAVDAPAAETLALARKMTSQRYSNWSKLRGQEAAPERAERMETIDEALGGYRAP